MSVISVVEYEAADPSAIATIDKSDLLSKRFIPQRISTIKTVGHFERHP